MRKIFPPREAKPSGSDWHLNMLGFLNPSISNHQSAINNQQSPVSSLQSSPLLPSSKNPNQFCKICNKPVPLSTRYPNRVCNECTTHTTDITGRHVYFENLDLDGGLVGIYSDTNENYPMKVCYISGILCKVEEVRFGGVAVEVVNANTTNNII